MTSFERTLLSRRQVLIAGVAGFVGLAVASCSSDGEGGSADTSAPAGTNAPATTGGSSDGGRTVTKVALVANQDAGDLGPVDGMIAGMEAAAEEFGFTPQFVPAPDPATHETTLRNLADSGVEVIMTTFFDLAGTVDQIAADYPDTIFITIVSGPIDQPNVNSLAYEFFKGAYVGGRYAAAVSSADKLAYIGGAPLPFAWADFNAFTAGAQSVRPEITTVATFVPGGFTDAPGGRELAASLFADGYDFIFTGAAESDLGVVEAALDNDGMVMVSSNLFDRAPANVAVGVLIQWEKTVRDELANVITGGELGRYRPANPESGEITFTVPQTFLDQASGDRPARAAAAVADFETTVAALISGELKVVEDTTEQS